MKLGRVYTCVLAAVICLCAAPAFSRDFGEEDQSYDLERAGSWEFAPYTGIYIGSAYSGGLTVGGKATYFLSEQLAINARFDNVFTASSTGGQPTSLTSAMFMGGEYELNDIPLGPLYPYASLNLGLFFASPAATGTSGTGALIDIGGGARYYLKEPGSGLFAEIHNSIFTDGNVFNLKLVGGYFVILQPEKLKDSDHDGVPDVRDKCPIQAEDYDGFQDADGCPEVDNDSDGVVDINDKCPNEPEDFDGFEDQDGCPDYDNDKDGIPDKLDRCPKDAEDMDGYQDDDGCLDPDNDGDGVLDIADKCPNLAEDIDGFQDEDGCSDPDNDDDKILDVNDDCPNDPETYNGYEDSDGCSDRVPAPTPILDYYEEGYSIGWLNFRAGEVRLFWQDREACRTALDIMKAKNELGILINGYVAKGASDADRYMVKRRVDATRKWLFENGLAVYRIKINEAATPPTAKDTNRVEIKIHQDTVYENR